MAENSSFKGISMEDSYRLPREYVQKYRVIPIGMEDEELIIAIPENLTLEIRRDLEVFFSTNLKFRVCESMELNKLVQDFLDSEGETIEGMLKNINSDEYSSEDIYSFSQNIENLEDLAQEAPIIRLVNLIISDALKERASDIHLEPFERLVKLRYRIDGILYEKTPPPRNLFPAIITRIKIMANLNIAERRLPQDGRIRIKIAGREVDIRVSTIPTIYGESLVMRLLDQSAVLLNLDQLGFDKNILDKIYKTLNYINGIVLVTGPTGSGKTTTLYSCLNQMNLPENKILTVEDPVEYQLSGINQMQVNDKIGFTFATGLRSILRQDPDIIMLGEVRDLETAQMAIQAALTGHLVFSTIHTNDSASTIARLIDMGLEDYLIASTIRCILAQRLVRKICPNCKEKYQPHSSKLKVLGVHLQDGLNFYRGVGCDTCNNNGYLGRLGIYELLIISPEIEEMISQNRNGNEIKKLACAQGMVTLREDGILKVKQGLTTIEEILRVTQV
ncbi:MAG: type II secretion system ATPase GspE [Halanaerobiales bacterium]|nr:type II secretion system ATPase GspE [Halanaerobiales bacterium]